MMSMEEMFYGAKETVWIVKPEKPKDDGNKGEKKADAKTPQPTALETSFGPFLPYYHPPYSAPAAAPKKEAETKTVQLKVPICCDECEDSVIIALTALKGVKNVKCDIPAKKVTVVTTTATADDVLLECRKLFKKSRLWTKDD